MLKWILLGTATLFIVALVVPRILSDDIARWHVDPTTATPSARPNSYLVADHDAVRLPVSPVETLERLDTIAMAEPRVTRLVDDRPDGRATYVQRSALFGFPDYVSVRAEADGTGSRLSVYSRSRFGQSDLGVNKARVERWLGKLESNAGRK